MSKSNKTAKSAIANKGNKGAKPAKAVEQETVKLEAISASSLDLKSLVAAQAQALSAISDLGDKREVCADYIGGSKQIKALTYVLLTGADSAGLKFWPSYTALTRFVEYSYRQQGNAADTTSDSRRQANASYFKEAVKGLSANESVCGKAWITNTLHKLNREDIARCKLCLARLKIKETPIAVDASWFDIVPALASIIGA